MKESEKVNLRGHELLMLLLKYEMASSWWMYLVWWDSGHNWATGYFMAKVKRKLKR